MFHLFRAALLSCICIFAMQICVHGETEAQAPQARAGFDLMERTGEARRLLEASPGLRYETCAPKSKVKVITRKVRKEWGAAGTASVDARRGLCRREVILAILDTQTGRIVPAGYWLDSDDIARANRLRALGQNDPEVPRFHPREPSNNFEVTVNRWNAYNSDLIVREKGRDDTGRYVVVANKYFVPVPRPGGAAARTNQYRDIVYVPYSGAIHADSLVEAGRTFLKEKVAHAFADLRQRQVPSRAWPGKPVADTISERFIRHLLINEHSDPRWMLSSDDKGRRVAERFLILVAVNGEQAFRLSSSRTGATGIAQIMPKTYDHVVRKYPEAELIRNTDLGRIEIGNAIKASVLVCDDLMAAVIRRALSREGYRRLFDRKSEDELDEIRAAIYNGGPGKYIRSTGAICPRVSETVLFVRKFNLIRDLNLFEEGPETLKVQLENSIGMQNQEPSFPIAID